MSREVDDRFGSLVDDLADEGAALDALVAPLDAAAAATRTPATGWDVRATIAHLGGAAWLAAIAVTEPEEFASRLVGVGRRDDAPGEWSGDAPGEWSRVLSRWRTERVRVVAGLRQTDARDRVPWIAGPMSAMSFASAQLMEIWAHGVDIAAALDLPFAVTSRLRHVAHLGVRTRPFACAAHGVLVPDGVDVRVELRAPDGGLWTWGDSGTDLVRGDALDFCLVVTQRRHVDESALAITGAHAVEWMGVAQAFAGPPTVAAHGRGV